MLSQKLLAVALILAVTGNLLVMPHSHAAPYPAGERDSTQRAAGHHEASHGARRHIHLGHHHAGDVHEPHAHTHHHPVHHQADESAPLVPSRPGEPHDADVMDVSGEPLLHHKTVPPWPSIELAAWVALPPPAARVSEVFVSPWPRPPAWDGVPLFLCTRSLRL